MIYVGCTNSSNQQFSLLIGTRVLGVTILHLPKESYIILDVLRSRNSMLVRYLVPGRIVSAYVLQLLSSTPSIQIYVHLKRIFVAAFDVNGLGNSFLDC